MREYFALALAYPFCFLAVVSYAGYSVPAGGATRSVLFSEDLSALITLTVRSSALILLLPFFGLRRFYLKFQKRAIMRSG